MFDSEGGGPDPAATMSLVSRAHRLVLEYECQLVQLAAHWSDLHHPDSHAPVERPLLGAEQGRQLGGEGTPEVLEFAAAELGARMETSMGSASALMADAVDLRHRLPELWQLILAGTVPVWKARKVAQATRHLSRSRAMHVDAAVAPFITGLPWGRFETLLRAKIIEADPKAAEEQARIWEAERFVRAGRTNQSGLKLLIAKANAGDVIWFMAMVNRIAEILRLQGDMDLAEYAAPKRSASWLNQPWRCSCCGSSAINSSPLRNHSSPTSQYRMTHALRSTIPLPRAPKKSAELWPRVAREQSRRSQLARRPSPLAAG